MSKKQDYKFYNVRAAAILTGSYVAGTVIEETHNLNQLIIYADFTVGELTDCDIKVEFSPDNNSFYQDSSEAIASGESTVSAKHYTLSATGKYRLALPIKDRYIKISATGNGTVTSSSLTIDAVVGIA